MPLNYHSTAGADMSAMSQMGDTANSIAYALPQLRMQSDKIRQQLALQRATEILRDAQTKEAVAHTGLYAAQTGEAQQKTSQGKMLQQGAQQGGQAASLMSLFQNLPKEALNNPNPLVSKMYLNAMQQGLIPQEGMTGDRGSIVAALQAMTRGNATQSVLTSPTASEKFLQPPKDLDVAPGHLVYPQGNIQQPPVEGRVNLAPGMESFMPGQQAPEFSGAQKPQTPTHLGNLATEAYKQYGNAGATPEDKQMALGILGQAGITNLPSMQGQQKPLTATNPKTGQKIQSLDGGKTWQPMQ